MQIRDGSNVYAVPKAKIERVNVGKTAEGAMREAEEIGQFVDPSKPFISKAARDGDSQFDIYKQDDYLYALDADTQMKLLNDDYTANLNIDAKAKRFSYIDEHYSKGRKADYQETDWRNAQTAGSSLIASEFDQEVL